MGGPSVPQPLQRNGCGAGLGATSQTSSTRPRRAERSHNLIQMGELSAARQALDGDPVAPGNDATLRALRDPQRRPQAPRGPLAPELTGFQPTSLVELEQDRLLKNLRSARRGAAGGPSGMTADHVRPLLDSERDAESFCRMCEEFARAQVSDEVVQALRMGRMTALGGIRGIVVGDFIRRLVARTLAQQLNPAIEQATSPFQFALTTKSGCECIAHIAQAPGVPCSKGCWRWMVAVPSSPLSDSSTVPHQLIGGTMTRESHTKSCKGRAGRKETL